MKKFLVITGPTASGKSSLSLKIAQKNKLSIISADSRQVYREMDIGTAKPTTKELDEVRHYLVDSYYINEKRYNAGDFFSDVKKILNNNKDVIVCGGTPFYLQTLIDGITQFGFNVDDDARKRALDFVEESIEDAYKFLEEIDNKWANSIKFTDKQRIARGLEVYYSTHKPLSYFHEHSSVEKLPYEFRFVVLWPDREYLYSVINSRVDLMIEQGLEDEVLNLVKKYSNITNYSAFNSVGYVEWLDYFSKKISHERVIELIKRNSRRYAKRQFTFLKNKFRDVDIISYSNKDEYNKKCDELLF